MKKNVFQELGMEEDSDFKGMYSRKGCPLHFGEGNDEKLLIMYDFEYTLSSGAIPITKERINLFLEAFDPEYIKKTVSILIHKEGAAIYGAVEDMKGAEELKQTFPNPDPIEIIEIEIKKEQQFISV